MSTAEDRWSRFSMPPARRGSIKRFVTTAIRQMRCEWDARIHRRGGKSPPPRGRLRCGPIGAAGFFNHAHLPVLNRKRSPVLNSGVPASNEERFGVVRDRLWYSSRSIASLEASLADAVSTSCEHVRFIGEAGEISGNLKQDDFQCRLRGQGRLEINCQQEVISDSVFNALQGFARCVSTSARPQTDVDDLIRTRKVVEALTLSARCAEGLHLDGIEGQYA